MARVPADIRNRRPLAKIKRAATNRGKPDIGWDINWNLDSDHDFEPDEDTPAEWWERQVDDSGDPDRLEFLKQQLESDGCRPVELLQALQHVSSAGGCRAKPAMLRRHIAAFQAARPFVELPPSIDRDFSLEDAQRLLALIDRYLLHLQKRVQARRRRRNPGQAQAIVALITLVQTQTGSPRYGVVGEMLRLLVDPQLTDAALRKVASRAELPQRREGQPKPPKRSTSRRGREAERSERARRGSGRWWDVDAVPRKSNPPDDDL